MRIAIMQPYFFPYIGHFQLIKVVDKWIAFDMVQYMRHHWVNRNRILHPKADWQHITVPLQKHPREILIKDVLVLSGQEWRRKIIAQLEHYRKKAPFFKETTDMVKDCLFSAETETLHLSRINIAILKKVCLRLDIKFDYSIFSEMDLQIGEISDPGEWALSISELLGVEEYINPPGGREIFDPSKFSAKGIGLKFLKPELSPYLQKGYEFVSGLSIIDVMMWNSKEEIRKMLCLYELALP
jgi:hypothetical protein